MAWMVYALMAAVLWGASYVLYEQLLRTMSSASAMLFSASGATLVYYLISYSRKTVGHDWKLVTAGGRETMMIGGVILINALANLLLLMSMKEKNATVSGLVEISYPLFTALFAWMFLKENQMSPGTALGAVLILSGVACIYYFNRAAG
ncbi:MAG: EamA family transporter [Alphaproteobacteria bacterium]|nr:EamA family transporter [Alphaproteobacteria bacterium]